MMIQGSCSLCGKSFEATRRGGKPQKYCSRECTKKAANIAFRDRNRPDRPTTCAECGGPVVALQVGAPRKFCSDACKMRASNRRQRRAWLPLAQPAVKVCAHCGQAFTAKSRNRIYCYDKFCAQAAYQARLGAGERRVGPRTATCDGCGTAFETVRPEARWCSKTCANRHWGNVRARQRGTASEAKYTDLEIFERDGWRCHLCKKLVRRDVPRTHPDGATIDHLVPTSLGGPDEPANVATAHWKCNRDKRARPMGEQLRLI